MGVPLITSLLAGKREAEHRIRRNIILPLNSMVLVKEDMNTATNKMVCNDFLHACQLLIADDH